MFEQYYEKVTRGESGIYMIGIWDKDGLEVDKKVYRNLKKINSEILGAEIADVVSRLSEFKYYTRYTIKLEYEGFHILVFSMSQDYFLLVVGKSDIISGRIGFHVHRHRDEILKNL